MNKTVITLIAAAAASFAAAESPLKNVNDQIPGTLSGRIQTLSMYRDFDGSGNGANTTAGFILKYTSPEIAGFDFGLAYNFADEIYSNNKVSLLANDDISVLNEAWLRANLADAGLTNTTFLIGRKITNGEVFRADDFRQKARAIESFQFQTADLPNLRLTLGHAIRMSNWIQSGDRADFNNFGDVFGTGKDTDGITWAEGVYSGVKNLEIALFDARAWDVANLYGTRAKWTLNDESALVGYFRHENDIGDAAARTADAFGLSLQQKIGAVTLEPGFFSVHGGKLRFEETTTGINHPLGASMMIYAGQFNGGADTAYLKATTKINKTVLYALYNYTWQSKQNFDGQELNLVIKQPITGNLSVAAKAGIGHKDMNTGSNTTATDARLFLTYSF